MLAAKQGELAVHAVIVGAAAIKMAWEGYQYSLNFEKGGPWDGYAPWLRQGWLWGRSVDLSDIQWREFRANIPAMSAAFALLIMAARLQQLLPHGSSGPSRRAALHLAFALVFLGYLHGACALFPLAFATLSFLLAHRVAGRQFGAAAIWGFNVAALLAARIWNGFSFGSLSPSLAFLDAHRGAVRWEICFNLSLLRMLSFALDLHTRQRRAAKHGQRAQQGEAAQQAEGADQPQGVSGAAQQAQRRLGAQEAAARWRQATPLPSLDDYSLVTYLSYVLYPPLYLAGPILTYQDCAWQLRQPPQLGRTEVLRYAAHFAADWACLELLTHTLYFNALAKHGVGARYSPRGLQYGPLEIAMTGFWVLCFMWLKFATMWRFFRLAALLGGVVAPDNMQRCFANNYDLEGFWKGWHSSYNAWLVRYMYVPLGGTRWRLLNIWPIFLFVALWHDLEWRLLAWAWLICLAFVPELLVKRVAASPPLAPWKDTLVFRHAAAVLAALNIAAMMAANLAGFVIGPEGLRALVPTLLRQPGLPLASLAVFFAAAQLMFGIRAREAAVAAGGAAAGAGAAACTRGS